MQSLSIRITDKFKLELEKREPMFLNLMIRFIELDNWDEELLFFFIYLSF